MSKNGFATAVCATGVCAFVLAGAPVAALAPQAAEARTITSDATMVLVQGTTRVLETTGVGSGKLSWSTTKASVATAKNNEIKAKKPGKATITLKKGGNAVKLPVKVVKRYKNSVFGTGYQLSGKGLKSVAYQGGKLVVKGKVKNMATGKSQSKTWKWKVASKVIDAEQESSSVMLFGTGDWMGDIYATVGKKSFGSDVVSAWSKKKTSYIWVKKGKVNAYSTGAKTDPDEA